MDPAQCLRCREPDCRTIIIGDDPRELMKFMDEHEHSKHTKRFEDTNLGRLPIEILVKILSYVTPECKKCFRQSELFKLRSVCKRMRELTKLPDFYKEIKLGREKAYRGHLCPLPPEWIFQSIIKRSGAQLKTMTCDWDNRTSLYHALQKRGGIIQKIRIGRVGNMWQEASKLEMSGSQIASILKYVNGLNPRALKNIRFGTSNYTWLSFDLTEDPGILDLAKKSLRKYPLFSKIVGLNIKTVGQHHAVCIAFADHGMQYITSLKRVTIQFSMSNSVAETKVIRSIKDLIGPCDFIAFDDISLSTRLFSYDINLVLSRKGEHQSNDARLGFEAFLKRLRKIQDPLS